MFRKLVSNLSFSPSLISELGFYARQLRREESRRLLGLVVALLALGVQLIVFAAPSESANPANANDLLYGGINSQTELLAKYDRNEQNIKDILSELGVTRTELQQTTDTVYQPKTSAFISGRTSVADYQGGERTLSYQKTGGGSGILYFSPASLVNSTYRSHTALIGQSSRAGQFAILKSSGNIALARFAAALQPTNTTRCALTPTLAAHDTRCRPCPSDQSLWVGASSCSLPVLYAKSATNSTQNQLATQVKAAASDRIVYTIRAKNIGDQPLQLPIADRLEDVLEYADVVDAGNATVDLQAKTISWADTPLAAGETVSRSFSVRLKPHLPATAVGISNPLSYDCRLSNSLGNTVTIDIACPASKTIETIAATLPATPRATNIIVSGSIVIVALYFYARARQQREELRLIRRDLNSGGTL